MKRLLIVLAGLTTVTACKKNLSVDMPSMSISVNPIGSTAATTTIADTFVYKLGDTTRFIFNGTTGNLIVYTGDATHNYDYKDRASAQGATTLSFTSAVANATQTNTLKLLATDKLTGFDSTSVVSASWTDITSKATIATNATATNSGNITLNDVITGANDSLFVALKYSGVTGTIQPTWTITNFVVNNVLPDVTYNLTSLANDATYFTKVRQAPSTAPIWVSSTTNLVFTGGAATNPTNTSWIVTKPLYVGRVSPDLSIPLINLNGYTNNASAGGYYYKYTAAGTYKVVFMSFNETAKDQKMVLNTFYVKVQ